MQNLTILNILFILTVITPLITLASTAKKQIIVAVIDTGFGYNGVGKEATLCKKGHKDFTSEKLMIKDFNTIDPVPLDLTGHGTNITGIIDTYVTGKSDYCLVIIKYYSPTSDNLKNSIRAIKYATAIKADFINYSSAGTESDKKETSAIKKYLNQGGVFVAAAGNSGVDVSKNHVYPAMSDSRIVIVGNLGPDGKRHYSSNYGLSRITWEFGVNMEVYGINMTGTSQATAKVTGKLVQKLMESSK